MGLSGHFYSHVDLVWSLYNVGTGCILGIAPESWKKGTQWILLTYVSHDLRHRYSTG